MVKDLKCFNKALLGDCVWRFYSEGESLWARVIKLRWGLSCWVSPSGGSGRRVVWWGEVLTATGDMVDGWFFSQLGK